MASSVRLALGVVYSYLTRPILRPVPWAALTTAVPTAATKRFSSSPRRLNEMLSSAARAGAAIARAAKSSVGVANRDRRVMAGLPPSGVGYSPRLAGGNLDPRR